MENNKRRLNCKQRANKTGFKGVRKEITGKYFAYVSVYISANKGSTSLGVGTFDTPEEAYEARKKYLLSLI